MMYKITKEDYFVWMVIPTSIAKTTDKEVFILHDDDTETLVTDFDNLDDEKVYGVELDFINNITNRYILQLILMDIVKDHTMSALWWLVGAEVGEIHEYIKLKTDENTN